MSAPGRLAGPAARVAAATLSGVLFGLAFPNASWLVVLPAGLVPLLWSLEGARPWPGTLRGWAFGTAFWLTTLPWIAYVVHVFGGLSRPVAALSLLVAAVLLALPFALLGGLVALAAPRTALAWLVLVPSAWVVQEWVRTYALSGFPWALAAYPLASVPLLVQTASLAGASLTSALVVAVNAGLHVAVSRRGRGRLLGLGAVAAAGSFALGWGAFWLRAPAGLPGPGPALRVLVVQPGVPQEARDAPDQRDAVRRDLFALTRRLHARHGADLVVWPESATLDAWPWSASLRVETLMLCRELGASVLLNTVWSDAPESEEAPYYNSALVVTADGPVLPPYHKLRLVPFGEYVPFAGLLRSFPQISRAVPGAFTPGTQARPIPLGSHRLGGAVCYEVVYPWIAREQTRLGADILFTLTNDSWYGTFGAQAQHFQAAVFRAVETGRPMLRSAVTGISGWVDGKGRVLASLGPGERGGIAGLLVPPDPAEAPPAVVLGDAFAWVCLAAVAVAILRARAVRRGTPAAGGLEPSCRGVEKP